MIVQGVKKELIINLLGTIHCHGAYNEMIVLNKLHGGLIVGRNINDINKKLSQTAGDLKPTDKQMKDLAMLSNKYKNKSEAEIEQEMMKLAESFSSSERADMIKKLQMLKNMGSLLDNNQRKKVELFIKLLSR